MAANIAVLLGAALDEETLTDLKILVGKKQVPMKAHKVVLALSSPELRTLIYPSYPKCINSVSIIRLPESDAVFKAILAYIYKGKAPSATVDMHTLGEIFESAIKYNILGLSEVTMEALTPSLSPDNVLRVLNVAGQLDFPNIKLKAWELVQTRTAAVMEQNLKEITIDIVMNILKDESLNIREVELFKLLMRWADQHCPTTKGVKTKANLKKFLANPLKLIRFPTMTCEEFANEVVPLGILSDAQATKILLYISSFDENRKNFTMEYPRDARKPKEVEPDVIGRGDENHKDTTKQESKYCDEELMYVYWFDRLRDLHFSDVRHGASKFWEKCVAFMKP